MTRTVQLRMLEVQRRVRERQEAERRAAEEAEARARRVREATRAIAPVVTRLESERNPVPLAWQGGAAGGVVNAASLAKKEFEATARRNLAEQRARVEAAERARPLLMLRSTLELRREEARRAALINAAKGMGQPGNAAWDEVVRGALAPGVRVGAHSGRADEDALAGELFDAEERELLGLLRDTGSGLSANVGGPGATGGSRR
jgi:uncharacterized protein YukE